MIFAHTSIFFRREYIIERYVRRRKSMDFQGKKIIVAVAGGSIGSHFTGERLKTDCSISAVQLITEIVAAEGMYYPRARDKR
jgi:hypothetical protein